MKLLEPIYENYNISNKYSQLSFIIYSIYKITNKINQKVYIGYTNDFEGRWAEHVQAANRGDDYKFLRAIRKHGAKNFIFEVICQSKDGKYLNEVMEPYFIEKYDSYHNGYNANKGGNIVTSGPLSEEHKIKISIAHMGRKKAKTARRKQSETRKRLLKEGKIKSNLPKEPKYGEDNPNIKSRKAYEVKYNDGRVEIVVGLNKFCRDNKHHGPSIWALLVGKKKKYKNIISIKKLD